MFLRARSRVTNPTSTMSDTTQYRVHFTAGPLPRVGPPAPQTFTSGPAHTPPPAVPPQAAWRWKFVAPGSAEAQSLTFAHLNGHYGLFAFVYGGQQTVARRKRVPHAVQSIFSLRAITYFIPVYMETVTYSRADLHRDATLHHLIALYPKEWDNFCERAFYGAPPATVAAAFFAEDRALARLFVQRRAACLAPVFARLRSWPEWPGDVAGYPLDVAMCYFPHDPPPVVPPDGVDGAAQGWAEGRGLDELEFWAQQQVSGRGRFCGSFLSFLCQFSVIFVPVLCQFCVSFLSVIFVSFLWQFCVTFVSVLWHSCVGLWQLCSSCGARHADTSCGHITRS